MPLRINLLAEAQAAEEMRRKDPVKRAVWVGGFVVFLVLLCAATLQFKIIAAKAELHSFDVSWNSIEKRVKEVTDHRASTHELEQRLSALDQFTTNRLLWATALNALQNTSVEGVQITRLRADQSFLASDTAKVHGLTTEKIVLSIEGRDIGTRPGEHLPKFKETLVSAPYFDANLQKTNKVQLTSLTAPTTEAGRSFVGFTLQLYFQEKERHLYE